MKQAIELLEQVLRIIPAIVADDRISANLRDQAERLVRQALEGLQVPHWETPEQRERRTGKKWPDEGAVYFYDDLLGWRAISYIDYRKRITEIRQQTHAKKIDLIVNDKQYPCVCATEAGKPPDDWKLEEENNA
jgi:hypothetical protein